MTLVRGHHEGSLYRNVRRGVWVAAISLPDGRRRRRQAPTRADALAELRKMQKAQSAEAIDASRIRLGDYLQRWVDDDRQLAPATLRKHESIIRVHLVPRLGHVLLSELSPSDVSRLLGDLGGLDPQSVRHVRSTLRRALADALRDDLVTRNAASLASPPKLPHRERPILDAAQARTLLESTRTTRYGPLWTILVTTGLRISEALGLAWSDVDSAIHVRHALAREHGEWVRRPPKTAKGRRTIPLTPLGIEALRAQREQQAADRGAVTLDGLVFTTERGAPIHATNLLPKLRADLAAAGLAKVGLHDLRHSCATVLFAAGVPLPVISDILGHSTIRITSDLYRHRVPELSVEAARRMQEALA